MLLKAQLKDGKIVHETSNAEIPDAQLISLGKSDSNGFVIINNDNIENCNGIYLPQNINKDTEKLAGVFLELLEALSSLQTTPAAIGAPCMLDAGSKSKLKDIESKINQLKEELI